MVSKVIEIDDVPLEDTTNMNLLNEFTWIRIQTNAKALRAHKSFRPCPRARPRRS